MLVSTLHACNFNKYEINNGFPHCSGRSCLAVLFPPPCTRRRVARPPVRRGAMKEGCTWASGSPGVMESDSGEDCCRRGVDTPELNPRDRKRSKSWKSPWKSALSCCGPGLQGALMGLCSPVGPSRRVSSRMSSRCLRPACPRPPAAPHALRGSLSRRFVFSVTEVSPLFPGPPSCAACALS